MGMSNAMLTLARADELIRAHLGDTPRARHTREVGRLMGELARRSGNDETLWTLVGLCHDLDYFAVAGDWSRHGILAGEWLDGELPGVALRAIAAHDHRTGVTDDSLLGDMLKLADTVANLGDHVGYAALKTEPGEALRQRLGRRVYLVDMFERLTARHAIRVADLV
jgi:predicted hydrolase (HD superfamily)